jgi:hypothetical protein
MMNEHGLSGDHTTIYRSRAAVRAGVGEKITPSSIAPELFHVIVAMATYSIFLFTTVVLRS